MSDYDRAAPQGNGWKKDHVTEDTPWRSQWTHENGTVRRDHGEYLEIIHPDGHRQYSGDGRGRLIFRADGEVEVFWNGTAALASAQGAGNRTHRITKAADKRRPAQLDDTFGMIYAIRGLFIIPDDHKPTHADHDIPGLPSDPDSPRALELLNVFHREAYQMLSAVVRGDAAEIRRVAAAVENHEGLRTGKLETPMNEFLGVAEAIRQAARKCGGIPSRPATINAYTGLGGGGIEGITMESFIEKLGRMGFPWLHAPHGKRGKKRVG